MTITRIQDDEKGVTAVFELFPQINNDKSKKAGRPIYDEIELCRIYLAANKQTVGAFPALDIWSYQKRLTEWGTEERMPVTYAMRFNKQYLEFKSGGKQSFSGTVLKELPFLSSAKRLELQALNIHTAEALASLDGNQLKMLGPGGRDLKNQAAAYLENAAKGVPAQHMADELSKRDAEIEALKRKIDGLVPDASRETIPASAATVSDFDTFEDADIQAWLADSGVTVDGRWGRARLISEAEAVLKKSGKQKKAA